MRYMGDINARARGLRSRLLTATELERCARSTSLPALQRELASLGYAIPDAPATPLALEQAARRHASSLIHILERWSGDERRPALAVVLEDEDRRSIRAVLRGAEQGAGAEARLADLIPTTSLSERALLALASQPTPADVVRLLLLWNHPFGAPLVSAASRPHPSLFEMEVALERAFAKRARTRAREGGSQLVEYVEQVIDLMNAWSALLHFVERDQTIAELAFIEGGKSLNRESFEALMQLESREQVQRRLAKELGVSLLGQAFREEVESITELEAAVLRAQIAWQKRAIRLDPSGAAPVIGFAIELRAEVQSLRGIIWGVALGAPAPLIREEMVL